MPRFRALAARLSLVRATPACWVRSKPRLLGPQAAFAREQREEAEAVYYGSARLEYPLRPLKEELPGTDVTLPLFKHLAAVIGAAPQLG